MITRGLRNNNPGNIRLGDPWQGLVPTSQRSDPDFCQFVAPEWGIRAIAKILHSYAVEGVTTLRQAINHWAPPVENDTGAYVNAVSLMTAIQPDIHIDLTTYEAVMPIVKAIIYHENGSQPYDDATIDKGLSLAGIEDQT